MTEGKEGACRQQTCQCLIEHFHFCLPNLQTPLWPGARLMEHGLVARVPDTGKAHPPAGDDRQGQETALPARRARSNRARPAPATALPLPRAPSAG
ncbi:hypothetical protein A3768_3323 [Ralstonia solanacearum]|nr:hypothetical protein A3768_3323 [Ralstonia solanacearum]